MTLILVSFRVGLYDIIETFDCSMIYDDDKKTITTSIQCVAYKQLHK